jgi:hypothetical protein
MSKIPMYGQEGDGTNMGDLLNCFFPDHPTSGKGFMFMKGSKTIIGGDTSTSLQIIDFTVSSSVWAGYIKISGVTSGAVDLDLGLVADASTLGAAYGANGNGVYALKLHEFVSVGAEGVFLSIDANSCPTTDNIVIEVGVIAGVAPASS